MQGEIDELSAAKIFKQALRTSSATGARERAIFPLNVRIGTPWDQDFGLWK